MDDLPLELLEGEWPFQEEVDRLKRAGDALRAMDTRIRSMTRELRSQPLYPRRKEAQRLKLRVTHSYTPPVTGEDEATARPGVWSLRIEGVDATADRPTLVNFSSYFRKATIELDPRIYADSVIEWTSFQKAHHDVDGLEISRTGSVPHTVRVKLLPAQTPERYSISPVLASAIREYLGPSSAFTKQDIVMATWEYIKRRNLIKEDDCRVVVCDYTLAEVLECVSLPFSSIIPALKPHLTPVRSVDLEYTLALDGEKKDVILEEKFFDVAVSDACELSRVQTRALREWDELQQEQRKELLLLKRQERDLVDRLHQAALKHEWMRQFASDPCGFTAAVLKSQNADEQILSAETGADESILPPAHEFSQPWVREVASDLLTAPRGPI